MKKIVLNKNIVLYSFPSENENGLGQNIYILINGNEALAIDTGYRRHFSQVLDDLKSTGIKVVKVMPSHFHPDHIDGILLLDKCEIYGNKWANETVDMFYEGEENCNLKPTYILKDNDTFTFGEFSIKLKHSPGHSDCSMQLCINDCYIHTGDLYMLSDKNEQVLPYVKYAGIKQHIESLINIKNSECEKYLLAHGPSPVNSQEITQGIDNRILYMKAIVESENTISVEDALAESTQDFVFLKWRDSV